MFTIGIERGPAYLRVVVSGPAGVDETCAGAVYCAELMRRTAPTRVLMDLLGFVPEFVRADGLDVLSTLYAGMPRLERLAVVIRPDKSHGLMLEVARHRDVAAREFDNLGEAQAWLEADLPSGG